MAAYENDNDSTWLGVQIYPSLRAELYATTWFNAADARIADFDYDGGEYAARLVGLDYSLQSQAMSGFSDVRFRRWGQSVGVNYRLTNDLLFNALLDYSRYDDEEPYLFDATGTFVQFYAGVSWIF